MYVVIHSPLTADDSSDVLILCHPLAHEHYNSYPFGVALTRELCKQNVISVRLTMRGYGNSTGDLCAVSMLDHVRDVRSAVGYVRRNMRQRALGILGIRMGGTLAILAAGELRPDRMVLLDPILNLKSYVRQLLRRQVLSTRRGCDAKSSPSVKQLWGDFLSGGQVEVDGHIHRRSFYDTLESSLKDVRHMSQDIPTLVIHPETHALIRNVRSRAADDPSANPRWERKSVKYPKTWDRIRVLPDHAARPVAIEIARWLQRCAGK